ncbi:MAG: isopenicillin N synthase family dioxygenase [Ilumatobacter sp.]|uniref:isopenicillin N synthase family dioxygenase n=1 Tax=Ilumatobacter sp. TaxID=1967498 RepID=UPI00391C7D6D
MGVEVEREIRVIDLADPTASQSDIDDALWSAAADIGFFQVTGHGIPLGDIDAAFEMAARFFSLPADVKSKRQMPAGTNSGWEHMTQRRPSTGTLDRKESYQVTLPRMERLDLWPTDDELADFEPVMRSFEAANHALAMRVLASFGRKLGFDDDFFAQRHDRGSSDYQSTLRLLHYPGVGVDELDGGEWRAGAHTDFDCLTLLHQRPGQRGLQLCPGSDVGADGATGELGWTSVEPVAGAVTCNIGDMLMRWSDDRLPSTLHRVRMPARDEYLGPRYSIAYFAQADRDAVIDPPAGTYEPITAHDYLQQRIAANFAR